MSNKLDINIETTSLTQGEIACLLSHLCLWDKMIKSDMDRIAIFEDDIYLSKSINSILENVKLNNVNFDILKLEKSLDYISVYKRNRLDLISSDKCKIYRLKSQHLGAAGYVITKKGAEKILSIIRNMESLLPIDRVIFEFLLDNENFSIYQTIPAMCIQEFILHKGSDKFPSSLEPERKLTYKISKKRKSKNIFIRISKEISRPFLRLYKKLRLLCLTKLEFIE